MHRKASSLILISCPSNTVIRLNWGQSIQSLIPEYDHYFSKNSLFFDSHFNKYSKGRIAPIYWPIQTISNTLTLWIYYQKIDNQTLLTCYNDFVEPKLEKLAVDLDSLKTKLDRSSDDEKQIDKIVNSKLELDDFKDELLRLSKFWQPNLNDGVLITAAPLWRLFQHKAWQKKLKQTWGKMEDGDYDWAHLAYTTWPERVLKKCYNDRNLAITHDVETDLWHEVEVIKGRNKKPVLEWQPKPLTLVELNSYIREKIATDERLTLYRSQVKTNGAIS
jgi:hypothetical protein